MGIKIGIFEAAESFHGLSFYHYVSRLKYKDHVILNVPMLSYIITCNNQIHNNGDCR